MVPHPDTNKMNNENSNTAQGDQIAAAFINAIAQVALASPDLNKSLTSFSNSIYLLQVKVAALESQVEDLDAVTTDQVEDIVSDRLSDVTPLTARNIVTLGLRGLVDEAVTEGVKI